MKPILNMRRLSTFSNTLLIVFAVSSFAVAENEPTEDRYFDSEGTRIHYIDTGKGEPIILLHGSAGAIDAWDQGDILQSLAKEYRVIAIDIRGHGKSYKPHGKENYGAKMGYDAIRLLDHLNIPKAHFGGYSMGAKIVAHLMVYAPERFLTATLGAGEPILEWDDANRPSFDEIVAKYQQNPRLKRPGQAHQDFYALASAQLGRETLVVTEKQLRSIKFPVLGIEGSEDKPEQIFYFEGIIPSLKIVVIDGATHGGPLGILRRPEFLQSMKEFLAMHSSGN